MSSKSKKSLAKSVLLDHFSECVAKLEKDFGVVVGVDRCKSIGGGRFFFNLYINGISYRLDAMRDAVQFLEGYKCCLMLNGTGKVKG